MHMPNNVVPTCMLYVANGPQAWTSDPLLSVQ